jgi:hypothetical protein
MGVPAGLKTYDDLNHLLGNFLLITIEIWKFFVEYLKPVYELLESGFGIFKIFGFTFELCLSIDLLVFTSL